MRSASEEVAGERDVRLQPSATGYWRSRFDLLREPDENAVASPPLLMAFDLLYHESPRPDRAAAA